MSLELSCSCLPESPIYGAEAGDLNQVATAASWNPFREVSIIAVPFGAKPGTEDLPAAEIGAAAAYQQGLDTHRRSQGARTFEGPVATLFGQQVAGHASVVNLNIDSPSRKPVLVVEWVVEAGERIWIVRASQEVASGDAGETLEPGRLAGFSDLRLASDRSLNNPTTVGATAAVVPDHLAAPGESETVTPKSDLAPPYWWNGSDCDDNHYLAKSGNASHRLGAVYRGMPACGPGPLAGGTDVLTIFPGGFGQYEWECVELSMRYLYLAYGINAYPGNGSNVVWNYPGSLLRKVGNGTAGAAPQAGDVLSYGATSTAGHTSVVTSSTVPSNGTCSYCIGVIEQNNSAYGSPTPLSINNWTVTGGPYTVSGWLHYAGAAVTGQMTSPVPGSTLAGSSVTFQWSGSGVAEYALYIGSALGGSDLYGAAQGTQQSATVNSLPTDGRRLYVRLSSLVGSTWTYYDYQYTAANQGAPAQMTSPVPGSTLPGSQATFQWTAGSGASQYVLYVGSSVGADDLYGAYEGTNRSVTVSLPTDGRRLYVRLYSLLNNGWWAYDYQYTAATAGGGSSMAAQMTSPAPGSTLPGSQVTFQWTAGAGVSQYFLYVGDSQGANDLFGAPEGTSHAATVRVPTDGRVLYVRLWSDLSSGWYYRDYVYRAYP